MYLEKISSSTNIESIIKKILKSIVSEEGFNDIYDGISLAIEDGSDFYSLNMDDDIIGFFLLTNIFNDRNTKIELMSIDEIWIKAAQEENNLGELLGAEIKRLIKELKPSESEIILTQSYAWLGNGIQESGFVCSEIKLEKVLPTPNNLEDVLELVKDCTPIDRIVQVLLESNNELRAEVVEEISELDELISKGWTPIIVVVTIEPDTIKIDEIVEKSNLVVLWDSYNLVYRGA